jgi:xanthine dehydrogenase YagR molybdenum-binding subunit
MARRVRVKMGFLGSLEERDVDLPAGEPAPWGPDDRLRLVATKRARLEGPDKVRGTARYTTDLRPAGMLFGRILRSPHPAARVVSVDLAAARRAPGVRAALAFPGKRIYFAGEEVAAVAAATPEQAEEALALVQVKYDVRPFVTDLEEARKPDAPKVHDGGNLRNLPPFKKGNVERGFQEAHLTLDRTFRTRVQTHSPLEAHGCVAVWEGEELTLYTSTQGIFSVRDGVAGALGIPAEKVRVLCDHMGAGFGAKLSMTLDVVIAARLAREAGAPVRIVLDRKEEHLGTGNRPDSVQRVRAGATREGKLTALHVVSHGSGGVGGGAGTSGPARNVYDVPNLLLEHTDVFTNLGPARPFRAPGHPQGAFALESILDELAAKLGVDPLEMRLRNTRSSIRHAQLKLGAERFGWKDRDARRKVDAPWKRGFGLASAVWYQTGRPGMSVEVEVRRDGAVEIRTGSQDIGGGLRTLLALLVAEELGLEPSDVTVRIGDTRFPKGPSSGGSSTTPSLAPPTRVAAWRVRQRLAEVAAKAMGVPAADVDLEGRAAVVRGAPGKRLPWKRLCGHLGDAVTERVARSPGYEELTDRIAGCQFAQVLVDPETGVIRVERVVAVQDCGIPVNRLTAESQILGGVIQGVSYALLEERIVDHRYGKMLNANLEQYKIAGSMDVPEIEPILFDVFLGSNATGTIGIGEPPTIPTCAAIANAVADALGVRVYELPMTPARVLAALGRKEEAR